LNFDAFKRNTESTKTIFKLNHLKNRANHRQDMSPPTKTIFKLNHLKNRANHRQDMSPPTKTNKSPVRDRVSAISNARQIESTKVQQHGAEPAHPTHVYVNIPTNPLRRQSAHLDLDDLWNREKQKHEEQMKTSKAETARNAPQQTQAELGGGNWSIVDAEESGLVRDGKRGEEGLEVKGGKDGAKSDEAWMLIHVIAEKGGSAEGGDEDWETV
jgi:hypothetical protein